MMSVRASLGLFFAILVFAAATIKFSAGMFLGRAVSADGLERSIREAYDRGEPEFAARLLLKGVGFSDSPEKFIGLAAGDKPLESYLKGVAAHMSGRMTDAESHFLSASRSDSPLIAARAAIHLEEIRYRTGIPHAEKIPF